MNACVELCLDVLDLPVNGDGHAAVEDIVVPEARRPTAFHSNHFLVFE